MKKLALITLVFFALAAVSVFAEAKKKNCGPKSKPCGNTCIAANKECHIKGEEKKAQDAKDATADVKDAKDAKKKNCGPKSKPCGNTCIAANKKCTK